MAQHDVVITGIGLVSSLGEGAEAHWQVLGSGTAAPALAAEGFAPFPVHKLPPLELDKQIPKKGDQRQMEPWQRLGTYAAGLAIDDAGARGHVADMHMIVSAGGGERDIGLDEQVATELSALPLEQVGPALNEKLATGLRPTLFLAQLSNLLAGNISIVHGVTGSSRTFMGEESAAADAVRIATARLAHGQGGIALVGGAFVATRWDLLLLYAAGGHLLQGDWRPISARPEGGMVLGGMACFLVLETAGHAAARGARPLARIAGIATDASRREAPGAVAASLAGLWETLRDEAPGGEMAILSGATGEPGSLKEERGLLGTLPAAALRTPASLMGHGVEAAFTTHLALGAIALAKGGFYPPMDPADPGQATRPASILVTGTGQWRGEALALLTQPKAEA